MGESDDGHYAYFVNRGQLAAGQSPLGGKYGIYLWHDGTLSYVGRASSGGQAVAELLGDVANTTTTSQQARVTPDGHHLLFNSLSGEGLLGYDQGECHRNAEVGCIQVYVYSADTGRLQCASCLLPGQVATAPAWTGVRENNGGARSSWHLSNAISADGRWVFFSTAQKLVPEDTDGVSDAYEYDTQTEQVHLLSGGEDGAPSYFLDASPDGSNAFFVTRQQLSGWDVDQGYDLYDARVNGGFPEPVPAASCQGDACQPAPAELNDPTPSSSTFAGPGDARAQASCAAPARRAHRLARRAKALRRHAKRAMRHGNKTGARKLARAAKARGKRAHRLSRTAKRCRRAERRAGK